MSWKGDNKRLRFTGSYCVRVEGWVDLRWMVTYWDGLPVSRQSPIHVVTRPDVKQLHLSRPNI